MDKATNETMGDEAAKVLKDEATAEVLKKIFMAPLLWCGGMYDLDGKLIGFIDEKTMTLMPFKTQPPEPGSDINKQKLSKNFGGGGYVIG